MNDFNTNYESVKDEAGLSAYMTKVFGWMFAGLLVSFGVAFVTSKSVALLSLVMKPGILFGLLIAELVLVFILSRNAVKYTYGKAAAMFIIYALLNGFTLSGIFIVYSGAFIAVAFLAAAGLFGAMAVYGKVTKKDLTKMGSIMFMLLIGIIIAMLINMFLGNSMLDLIISAATVTIFSGLTAWDMQKLKQYYYADGTSDTANQIAVVGALSLYLDFINIFLSLLRIFGSRD